MVRDPRQIAYDTRTRSSLGRLRRSVIAWLGVVLLAFNVVGGGALLAQPGGSVVPFQEDDHLVICTVGGLAVVDTNGTPVAPPAEHAGLNGFCGYCLPLTHGAALATTVQTVVAPFSRPVAANPDVDTDTAPVGRALRLALARGPPQA